MKKTFLFSLGLIVAFSSLFVSCSDNNGDNDKNSSLFCQISVSNTDGGSAKITNYIGSSANVLIGNGVEVVATPDNGYNFLGWYLGNSDVPVSTDAVFTFTASKDIALIAKFKEIVYEAIDLGLSVKWASCNVGANAPEEYGDYFAWGEISPKSRYSDNNSVTYGKAMSDISGNAQYDAARANWGGNWRMPTRAEQDELFNECTWEWTTLNGVNGYRVTGPNGNSIFLPATGYRDGTSLVDEGSYGNYWSSTPSGSGSDYARSLEFDSNDYFWNNYYRYGGYSVRPVLE